MSSAFESPPKAGASTRVESFAQNPLGRKEPVFADFDRRAGEMLHSAHSGSNEVDGQSRFSGNAPVSRVTGISLMFAIFSIGAVAGLGLAWWLTQPIGAYHSSADIDAMKAIEKARRLAENSPSNEQSGTDPGELPYEGKPSSRAEDESTVPESAVSPMDRLRSLQEQASEDTEPVAPDEVAPSPPKPALKTPSKSETVVKPPPRQVTKAPQQRRVVRKTTSNQEIDRIKEQAAEELKKKTEIQRMKEEARKNAERSKQLAGANPGTRSKNLHAMVARCESASNFIQREICKWEVCGGMWGKNGCPSYESPANLY